MKLLELTCPACGKPLSRMRSLRLRLLPFVACSACSTVLQANSLARSSLATGLGLGVAAALLLPFRPVSSRPLIAFVLIATMLAAHWLLARPQVSRAHKRRAV